MGIYKMNPCSILVALLITLHSIESKRLPYHPETDLTLEQRIEYHGYPVKAYELETEDGYIITLYNIPHGLHREYPVNTNKSAVMFIHGMGGMPHNFVALGRNKSSPYYFADRGMDVWLFSSRGLESSSKRKHRTLDRDKDPEFWHHSFHEIGVYDLSVSIDFILNHTGQNNVALIGHSAGGNAFFCLMSERPEYNKKIKVGINWGSSPINRRLDYPTVVLGCLLVDVIKHLSQMLGIVELPFIDTIRSLTKVMCQYTEWQDVCFMAIWGAASHKPVLARAEDMPVIATNLPRMAIRQGIHFMNNVNDEKFKKYDHGPKKNMKIYGQRDPPEYNLSAATAPVAFFFAKSDQLVSKENILEATKIVPNTVLLYEIPSKEFTHTDFIFGHNVTEIAFKPTYDLMMDVDKGLVSKVNISEYLEE